MPNMRQHTFGHVNCPACEESRLALMNPGELAHMPFPEAARIWLDSHSRYIGPESIKDYRKYIKRLTVFFGQMSLNQIHPGHIEEYQKSRQAGPVCINHEMSTLTQILKRAALWSQIEPFYRPLKIPKSTRGKSLTDEEKLRLFQLGAKNPRWRVAYLCSVLSVNTTAGPGEIRFLRIKDIDLNPNLPRIHIREGVKNENRIRWIDLNGEALFAVSELMKRAARLGATQPNHFLLPHRADEKGNSCDPTRPMFGWRKAWNKLRIAAGMPELRMYDLRHHVITELLENPDVSERTVMDIAGHVSNAMLKKYSHIRMKTRLAALHSLKGTIAVIPLEEKE